MEEEQRITAEEKIRHILKVYALGQPLFPREVLQDLSRQIDQGRDEVYIADLDGVAQKHSLKVPTWCADWANSYRISYCSIQAMTTVNPFVPDEILRDQPPVAICYTRNDKKPENPLHEVRMAFDNQREVWQTSEACDALQKQLTTLSLSRPITKIVCFGLGTLGRLNTRSAARSHTQHAAVGTMVQALKARQDNGTEEIRCFAQDPAYDEVDIALLRSIDITPLDDPKGFLAVDESTLVFCVSPNVPVKQIIADVQWPAAMIWNTVRPSEPDVAKWEQRVRNGQVTWVCPYTTDPDSSRVRKMALSYSASRKSPRSAHIQSIYTSTYGILFFETPYHGSSKARLLANLQKIAQLAIPKKAANFATRLVKALEEQSEMLQNISDQFAPVMAEFRIYFFWEEEETDLKYTKDLIVEEASAALILENTERCGIAADHRGMCKFNHPSLQGFRTAISAIRRYSREAPEAIRARHERALTVLHESQVYQATDLLRSIRPGDTHFDFRRPIDLPRSRGAHNLLLTDTGDQSTLGPCERSSEIEEY
ncbi:hypothetical protein KXX35_006201 [Aspergillus fumigatus]|nr:hypothetical protein KXX25_003145 [Aspergillus fumigatus]KAH1828290.1 hypothetical protein KXX35_006201 [Aspergillus fumigatus]KAH2098045.1 hypothetical protein KXW86_000133 [Aspergillus fumigatus]